MRLTASIWFVNALAFFPRDGDGQRRQFICLELPAFSNFLIDVIQCLVACLEKRAPLRPLNAPICKRPEGQRRRHCRRRRRVDAGELGRDAVRTFIRRLMFVKCWACAGGRVEKLGVGKFTSCLGLYRGYRAYMH